MRNIQKQSKTYKTVSPWTVLLFSVFIMATVNAVVIVGLIQMSSALQIAAVAAVPILIALGVLFSVIELNGVSRLISSPIRSAKRPSGPIKHNL